MLHGLRHGAGPIAVGAVAGLVAAFAFGNTSSLDRTPAKGQPYKLYTHCGIDEARSGNQPRERETLDLGEDSRANLRYSARIAEVNCVQNKYPWIEDEVGPGNRVEYMRWGG